MLYVPHASDPARRCETADEQRTEFALWTIARSPLILGGNLTRGNLTRLDALTRSLITNQDLLFMNQNATDSRPVDTSALGPEFENVRVWRTSINEPGARGYADYFGFFNLDDKPVTVRVTWKQLGLDGKHSGQSCWDDSLTKQSKEITVNLPAHGSAVYQVR